MAALTNQMKRRTEDQESMHQTWDVHRWNRENLLDVLIESFKYCQTLSEVDDRESFLKELVSEVAEAVRQEEMETPSKGKNSKNGNNKWRGIAFLKKVCYIK